MIRNQGIIDLVCDRDVPRCEIAVAFVLSAYADNQGCVVASLDTIASKVGYGPSVVAAALVSLREKGYIAKEKRGVYRVDGAKFCEPSNPYVRSYMAAPA